MVVPEYKKKLQYRFNQAQDGYDKHCSVQDRVCTAALTLLTSYRTVFASIADLACGTGNSTQQLLRMLSYERLYALDFSESLLKQARQKLPKTIPLILADFDYPILAPACVDLLFCNMGCQWSVHLGETLKTWRTSLQNEGWLLFSMPITPNFPELKPHSKWPTWSHTAMKTLIQQAGFRSIATQSLIYTQHFADVYQALRSLKETGTNYSAASSLASTGLSRSQLRSYFFNPEQPQLTYHLGIYLVQKERE